jgi:hypothetical protein
MSIWSTRLWLEPPPRDQYGREGDELARSETRTVNIKVVVDVAASSMSSVVRLGINGDDGGDSAYLSIDECRQLIEALRQSITVACTNPDCWNGRDGRVIDGVAQIAHLCQTCKA